MIKIIFFLSIYQFIFADQFQDEIQSMFSDITTPRSGIKPDFLNNISNPFLKRKIPKDSQISHSSNSKTCGKFSLKYATQYQFMQIPTIDGFYAKKIIDYRDKYGFNTIKDLEKVPYLKKFQIESIKRYIKENKCPVIKKRKSTSRKRKHFSKLKVSIIFNQRAKIFNHWYKTGDKIRGYTISKISDNTVTLKKGNKTKILKIPKKRTNHKIFINLN
jgi:hypothetical protein